MLEEGSVPLQFNVLGPVEVRRDGEPISVGGPQQRRILAVLLTEVGQVISVDRLVDTAWSDEPPAGARRTVMTYISRLRLALGDGHLETHGAGYRLAVDEEAVDAIGFERSVDRARAAPPTQAISELDRALGLWSGRAFDEFADEWWAMPYASRLEELRLTAYEMRADGLIATGAHDRAAADLEELVRRFPLRERFAAQLMTAYDTSGRRADALRAYARHRRAVVDETGLEPSEELRALESAILAGGSGTDRGHPRPSTRGYALGPLIAEGAYGSVYQAMQPGIGREVAVKVIRSELADDPDFVGRFEAEAQLVAHLEHPHVVPLYDYWREPGGAYLVFRLLRGGTAASSLLDGPWTLERADQLVTEVGGALVAAHAAGIVHRDVKPANVLFDERGSAYLADFGIAYATPQAEAEAGAPPAGGSAMYAAPEQFRAEPPSPSSDQYSFATMVWELLAGHPSTDGATTSEILIARLRSPVASLQAARPDLPPAIDDVLQQATAPDAARRFAAMEDFIAAWRSAARRVAFTTDELGLASSDSPPSQLGSTAPSLSADVANPYKGLRPFGEADARRFHGRADLIGRLSDLVSDRAFVTVVGPSGSGKSSLVRAGLVPRLRAEGMRVVLMVPGADPITQLRLALLSVSIDEPVGSHPADLVRSVALQGSTSLVVVIDQLEELWTLATDPERERFVEGLADLVDVAAPGNDVRIVATVRADFFDRPLAHPKLGPLVAADPFAVTPMTLEELHEVVVAPAAGVGVVFEPGLDTTIVAEVAGSPGGLPLLQFALTQLFDQRDGRVITRSTFEAMGGVAGAIASRAEQHYSTLDEPARASLRELLRRLVVPGEGADDTRRRVRVSELPPTAVDSAHQLDAERLLVADRDPATREPTYEIAHESLLRSWPRLREWLTEDRELIRRVWQIGLAAAAWDAAGRADSELYRGARLEAADEVKAMMADQLTEPEHDFVVASRAAADAATARERRTRRRLRRGFVATSVALIVALIAGSAALQQREQAEREADEADVARLISLSGSLVDTKRDVAALLALEASQRSPGPATTSALASLLFDDPALLGHLSTGTATVGSIEWDPESDDLYSVGLEAAEPVRIDPNTHEVTPVPVESWQPGEYVRWFVPVGDGSALVADATRLERPSTIERVDLRDGHVIARTPIEPDTEPLPPVVSPDGRRAAVLTWNIQGTGGDALVIDLATMRVLAAVPQPGPPTDQFWGGNAVWLDDERVLVGSPSGRLLVWAPDRNVVVSRWNDPPANDVTDATALRLSPDRETLVVVGHLSRRMMAFDTATGARRWSEAVEVGAMVALDPRSSLVWAQQAGNGSSRMLAYDLLNGRRLPGERDVQYGTVCDARTSPDGTTLALASCNEGTIAIWSLDGRASAGAAFAPPGWATAPNLWSPDGRFVATFRDGDPEQIEVVDVRDGHRHAVGGATATAGIPPAFRQDGILQIVDARSNHIVEHDPNTGATLDTGIELPGRVSSNVAVRGRRSAYGLDDGRIALVETGDRQLVRTISTDLFSTLSLAWSGDGARIFASGQTEEAQVFDVATGARIDTLPAPAGSLAVSPDHATLVTGAFDGSINLYDAETLQPMGDPLDGITTFPSQIQFTPDGRTIIVSGIDSTMRFFDVASRLELGGPLAITSLGAAVAPDSSELAVSTEHGVQRLALDVEALQTAACQLAGRNLTIEEWEQYIGGVPRRTCSNWPAPVAQLEPTAPDERRIRNQAGLSF